VRKSIDYYMGLDYPVEISKDENGYYAHVPLLPGCQTWGDSPDEVWHGILEAKQLWIETACERGRVVPEPAEKVEHSGRFVVRVPRTLHDDLAAAARSERISLNQYIQFLLTSKLTLTEVSKHCEKLEAGIKHIEQNWETRFHSETDLTPPRDVSAHVLKFTQAA